MWDLAGKLERRPYTTVAVVEWRLAAVLRRHPARRLLSIGVGQDESGPTPRWQRRDAEVAAAAAVDGRYLQGTNDPTLDANQMLALAKRRDVPEKRYATIKGPLVVRPVYLRKQERILGLISCTMVALLAFALLELLAQRAAQTHSGKTLLEQFAPGGVGLGGKGPHPPVPPHRTGASPGRHPSTTSRLAGSHRAKSRLSGSEVVTPALLGEWAELRRDRGFHRCAHRHRRAAFPTLPHRSQINRLVCSHQAAIVGFFRYLAGVLGAGAAPYEALDGSAVRVRNVKRRGAAGWPGGRTSAAATARAGTRASTCSWRPVPTAC